MKIAARVDAGEVQRALRRVAGVGSGLPRIAREALEPVLDDLRRATPVDTGALRDSSRLEVSRRDGAASVGWSSGRRVRRAQMLAVEFGNRARPGRRVLSSLFDSERDAIERRFVGSLRRGIDSAWNGR